MDNVKREKLKNHINQLFGLIQDFVYGDTACVVSIDAELYDKANNLTEAARWYLAKSELLKWKEMRSPRIKFDVTLRSSTHEHPNHFESPSDDKTLHSFTMEGDLYEFVLVFIDLLRNRVSADIYTELGACEEALFLINRINADIQGKKYSRVFNTRITGCYIVIDHSPVETTKKDTPLKGELIDLSDLSEEHFFGIAAEGRESDMKRWYKQLEKDAPEVHRFDILVSHEKEVERLYHFHGTLSKLRVELTEIFSVALPHHDISHLSFAQLRYNEITVFSAMCKYKNTDENISFKISLPFNHVITMYPPDSK